MTMQVQSGMGNQPSFGMGFKACKELVRNADFSCTYAAAQRVLNKIAGSTDMLIKSKPDGKKGFVLVEQLTNKAGELIEKVLCKTKKPLEKLTKKKLVMMTLWGKTKSLVRRSFVAVKNAIVGGFKWVGQKIGGMLKKTKPVDLPNPPKAPKVPEAPIKYSELKIPKKV